MKTKIIILAISVIAYTGAYSQKNSFIAKNNKAYNIEETSEKMFLNGSGFVLISPYGIFYPMNQSDKSPFEYGIDIGQYNKMLTKNRYFNLIVNATTVSANIFNNHPFRVYETNGRISSFKTDVISISPLKIGLSVSLFDLAPKNGFKSSLNFTPYPGIKLHAFCFPFSYNSYKNPYTNSTKTFFAGFNNAGAGVSVLFNKLELFCDYTYHTYPDMQINMPENMLGSLEPDLPRGLLIIGTRFSVAFSGKDIVKVKHKIPKIVISKTKIFQDVKSLKTLNPIGKFQIVSSVKPLDGSIDLNLSNIKVSSPSDKVEISNVLYIFEKTKKEYVLSFDIQVNGVDPSDLVIPVKFFSNYEYLCTEDIKLTIDPDSAYIAAIKPMDLATFTPNFYELCESVSEKISKSPEFNTESSVLIYLPDTSKLGHFIPELIKMHLTAKCIIIAGTPEAEYFRPDYKIYTTYTNNENSNTMFLTLTVENCKTKKRLSPFQDNIKYSEGIEKSYLKALSLFPGDYLLTKL
ncbi:MAG: hypothetical protein PHW83_12440 [Bacteroidales bacterium]|nr:hypothetical protein [Bacteroidales bacterium]